MKARPAVNSSTKNSVQGLISFFVGERERERAEGNDLAWRERESPDGLSGNTQRRQQKAEAANVASAEKGGMNTNDVLGAPTGARSQKCRVYHVLGGGKIRYTQHCL